MGRRDLTKDVGRLLRTRRESRGLSQARLAERVGATQQWLSQVERGALNPTLRDLERFFGGLGLRLRFEAVPVAAAAAEDPDLLLGETEEDRIARVIHFCLMLDKLADLPHLVGGRLAAFAHGMPVRVERLDLIVAEQDRAPLAAAIRRFSAVRWSERWQEFCDYVPPERPGPLRWLIGHDRELRVTLAPDLPGGVPVRIRDRELRVPPLPWLAANDPDIADLRDRLTAAGWP